MTFRARRAFTLIEAAIVIIIIAMLVSIVLVAVTHALKTARIAGERQLVHSLKMAVDQFKTDFDFYPPLVDDAGGPISPANTIKIKDDDFLMADPGVRPGDRFSKYSLVYYVIGVTPKHTGTDTHELDGMDGPGITQPLKTGQFTRRGKGFNPVIDPSKSNNRVKPDPEVLPTDPQKIVILDRWEQPIRYYRWLPEYGPNGQVLNHHVPPEVGDPATKPELRAAQFAIVSLGPDPLDNKDNIVEVGP